MKPRRRVANKSEGHPINPSEEDSHPDAASSNAWPVATTAPCVVCNEAPAKDGSNWAETGVGARGRKLPLGFHCAGCKSFAESLDFEIDDLVAQKKMKSKQPALMRDLEEFSKNAEVGTLLESGGSDIICETESYSDCFDVAEVVPRQQYIDDDGVAPDVAKIQEVRASRQGRQDVIGVPVLTSDNPVMHFGTKKRIIIRQKLLDADKNMFAQQAARVFEIQSKQVTSYWGAECSERQNLKKKRDQVLYTQDEVNELIADYKRRKPGNPGAQKGNLFGVDVALPTLTKGSKSKKHQVNVENQDPPMLMLKDHPESEECEDPSAASVASPTKTPRKDSEQAAIEKERARLATLQSYAHCRLMPPVYWIAKFTTENVFAGNNCVKEMNFAQGCVDRLIDSKDAEERHQVPKMTRITVQKTRGKMTLKTMLIVEESKLKTKESSIYKPMRRRVQVAKLQQHLERLSVSQALYVLLRAGDVTWETLLKDIKKASELEIELTVKTQRLIHTVKLMSIVVTLREGNCGNVEASGFMEVWCPLEEATSVDDGSESEDADEGVDALSNPTEALEKVDVGTEAVIFQMEDPRLSCFDMTMEEKFDLAGKILVQHVYKELVSVGELGAHPVRVLSCQVIKRYQLHLKGKDEDEIDQLPASFEETLEIAKVFETLADGGSKRPDINGVVKVDKEYRTGKDTLYADAGIVVATNAFFQDQLLDIVQHAALYKVGYAKYRVLSSDLADMKIDEAESPQTLGEVMDQVAKLRGHIRGRSQLQLEKSCEELSERLMKDILGAEDSFAKYGVEKITRFSEIASRMFGDAQEVKNFAAWLNDKSTLSAGDAQIDSYMAALTGVEEDSLVVDLEALGPIATATKTYKAQIKDEQRETCVFKIKLCTEWMKKAESLQQGAICGLKSAAEIVLNEDAEEMHQLEFLSLIPSLEQARAKVVMLGATTEEIVDGDKDSVEIDSLLRQSSVFAELLRIRELKVETLGDVAQSSWNAAEAQLRSLADFVTSAAQTHLAEKIEEVSKIIYDDEKRMWYERETDPEKLKAQETWSGLKPLAQTTLLNTIPTQYKDLADEVAKAEKTLTDVRSKFSRPKLEECSSLAQKVAEDCKLAHQQGLMCILFNDRKMTPKQKCGKYKTIKASIKKLHDKKGLEKMPAGMLSKGLAIERMEDDE